MKKSKTLSVILISIPLILIFLVIINWHEPKYGIAKDMVAHFGKDAEYDIYDGGTYVLEDQVNKVQLDPMVYRYYYKNNIAYIEGSKGFTIIDVKNQEVKTLKSKNELSSEEMYIFENKNFKVLDENKYMSFTCKDIISKDGYSVGNENFYIGYESSDNETKTFLKENSKSIVDEIRLYYKNNYSVKDDYRIFLESISSHIANKFNIKINKIYVM